MPNPKYQKGYRFEQKVRKYFEQKDCLVFRSAGSKGIADLIVIPKYIYPHTILIQCKTNGKITKQEVEKLDAIINKYIWCEFWLAYQDKEGLKFLERRQNHKKNLWIPTKI